MNTRHRIAKWIKIQNAKSCIRAYIIVQLEISGKNVDLNLYN